MGTSVVELRQYTLKPGQRDALIELFDSVLIAGQEAAGMRWLGAYRDLDRPDRLVFMRAFPDMAARRRSLVAFYEEGAVWKANRDAANATMLDWRDVLLLRPIEGPDAAREPASLLVAEVEGLETARWYETEPAPNDYPRLPVREGERYLVVVAGAGVEVPAALTRSLLHRPERLRLAVATR